MAKNSDGSVIPPPLVPIEALSLPGVLDYAAFADELLREVCGRWVLPPEMIGGRHNDIPGGTT